MTQDIDPLETSEWLDAFDSVIRSQGEQRATFLLQELLGRASQTGIPVPDSITTPFHNTIPPSGEKRMPGDLFMERRIRSLIRWNALAMVMRGNANSDALGGHIASFSSAATL